jgi:acetyltransferase-like isoleucine patch superfamily enzyme
MNAVRNRSRARFDDPLSYLSRARDRVYSMWLGATFPFASSGRNLRVQYPCVLHRAVADRIRIGDSVVIRKDAWLNVPLESESELNIVIEDNCLIGARNVISAKNMIHIERDVILATAVLIQDHHHAYEDINLPIRDQGCTPGGKIRIERGCWIGQGAAIVCNEGELIIGRNSVIGANSLITKSCPPNSVVLGNPGRLARQFDAAKGGWIGGAGRGKASELAR